MTTVKNLTNNDIGKTFRTFFSKNLKFLGDNKFKDLETLNKQEITLKKDTIIFENTNNMKRAFTLVEMLFVIGILVTLFLIAVPALNITKSAINFNLKQDAYAAKSLLDKYYNNNFNYNEFENTKKFEDTNNDGIADKGGENNDGKIDGEKVFLSNNNVLYVKGEHCEDMSNFDGYSIKITNKNSNKEAVYNSCTDSKPYLINK